MFLRTLVPKTWGACSHQTSRRAFHLTSSIWIRKKPDFAIVRSKSEEERIERKKKAMEKYTPSPEQATLIRETILVRSYLDKLEKELPLLQTVIPSEPYVPPTPEQYLRFRFEEDFKNPENPNVPRVKLLIHVPDMVKAEQLTPQQVHLLTLLCENHYYPRTQTIEILCLRYTDRAQNREWLRNLLSRLLDHVKTTNDFFLDIQPDLSHVETEAKALARLEKCRFPEAWLAQQDATALEKKPVGNE